MANRKTLFIVGAGASTEANLPTSHVLKQNIANILSIQFDHDNRRRSGDPLVCEALKLESKKGISWYHEVMKKYLYAAWRIRDAMPQAISIDNFIDAHQGNERVELCGKLAIVRSILKAERESSLYADSENPKSKPDFRALEETWFNSFFQLLTENCNIDGLESRLESIAFIIFNYDRCVEHFLYHSLQNYYGISPNESAELIQKIKIYHPYGTTGYLPWQESQNTIGFGVEPGPAYLLSLTSQIKTFTEGTDPDSSEIRSIRQRILTAKVVLFLGFHFHRQNLELLNPANGTARNHSDTLCFATAHGISSSDCGLIQSDLRNLNGVSWSPTINLRNDLKCNQLFHEFWRNLSFN